MSNQVFNEKQSYKGSWIMYLILLTEIPTLILMLVLFITSDEKQEMGIALVVVILVMALSFFLILSISLETRIDQFGIKYKYSPFIRTWRIIPKKEIIDIQVISFNPIFDFGGYGIKSNKTTKLYNVLADEGLLVNTGEKRKILIGTSERKKLEAFLTLWKEEVDV
ncbi:hypothetical protein JYB64_19300 [Algoriphagus aestuarii]|nr:hypothetical protein [Algoriphagus aestuarii]